MELQLPHTPRTVKLLPTPYLPSLPSVNLLLYSSVGSDNHMITSASDKRFGLADTPEWICTGIQHAQNAKLDVPSTLGSQTRARTLHIDVF